MTTTARMPYIAYGHTEGEAGYHVGVALDELVTFAREQGCSEEELRERLEESFDRYEDGGDGDL